MGEFDCPDFEQEGRYIKEGITLVTLTVTLAFF